MGNLTGIMPFSELVERAQNLAREDATTSRTKFKGLINDAYCREVPRKPYDWEPLIASSQISCTARYNTGTVAISAGDTSITGTGTVWTSAMTNRKIRIGSNPNIYTFTYVSGTTGTISPAYSGASDASGAGYEIFDDDYTLASDFSRFLKNGSLYRFASGKYDDTLKETPQRIWSEEYTANPSDTIERIRVRGFDSSRLRILEINPPPKTAIVLPYDYIKILAPMTEYRTGTITTLANAGTAVTGSGTDFDGYYSSSYRYYFRIDRDGIGDSSVWYLVSAAASDTSLTLSTAYAGTAISSGTENYTISMIPDLPNEFHDWLLYLAVIAATADQDDPMVQLWMAKAKEIERECKTLYKSRRTDTQFEVEDDVRG
jgi:hypothetical protein